MAWFDNGWGLSLIVFLPLLGTIAVLLTPKKNLDAIKALGVAFTAVPAVGALLAAARVDYGPSGFHICTDLEWITSINATVTTPATIAPTTMTPGVRLPESRKAPARPARRA
jgi:hypothetical protein